MVIVNPLKDRIVGPLPIGLNGSLMGVTTYQYLLTGMILQAGSKNWTFSQVTVHFVKWFWDSIIIELRSPRSKALIHGRALEVISDDRVVITNPRFDQTREGYEG